MRIKHVRSPSRQFHSLEKKKRAQTNLKHVEHANLLVQKNRAQSNLILFSFTFIIQIKEKSIGQSEHVHHANLQVSQFRANVTWFTGLTPVSNRQRWHQLGSHTANRSIVYTPSFNIVHIANISKWHKFISQR